MGWQWLGRLRNTTYLKPVDTPDELDEWVTCKAMYGLATRASRDFGAMDIARSKPLTSRVVLHAKPPKGRKHRNRQGAPACNSNSRKNAQRESEPWLLVASSSLKLSARQLIALYGRRMQIELSFRDLKSHRYGQGFEDSLTRKGRVSKCSCCSARWPRLQAGWWAWHGVRKLRHRRLARTVPIETTPLLGDAAGS